MLPAECILSVHKINYSVKYLISNYLEAIKDINKAGTLLVVTFLFMQNLPGLLSPYCLLLIHVNTGLNSKM